MATINKRGPYQYQAIVRCKGYPTQTRTLETTKAANDWARDVEAKMRRGEFSDRSTAESTTLGDALERYRLEVTPAKRGHVKENYRLLQLMRHPLALRSLASLQNVDFSTYRDQRLKEVSPKTVQLELSVFSAVLNTARRDWSISVANTITDIRKPKLPRGRSRRLVGDEEKRLFDTARKRESSDLNLLILLAIETGMRCGEMVSLTWDQIDLAHHFIHLDMTKNGTARDVPLSVTAESALRSAQQHPHGRLTGFQATDGVTAAFSRLCRHAGITNLRFHDLRDEAASRWAKILPAATLAKIFGWKTLQMVMRYYNPTPDELVAAIRQSTAL
ncbi:integrase [Undibacterium sp. GrIS 1.8]|uniref:site-specific integrase n=1 Tax=Undibacterium sp. GrIS 1.8 TaxID=3143934 RepID=UPI0033965A65